MDLISSISFDESFQTKYPRTKLTITMKNITEAIMPTRANLFFVIVVDKSAACSWFLLENSISCCIQPCLGQKTHPGFLKSSFLLPYCSICLLQIVQYVGVYPDRFFSISSGTITDSFSSIDIFDIFCFSCFFLFDLKIKFMKRSISVIIFLKQYLCQ